MGIKLMLNLALRENYVFCDPNAPLHLSLGEPFGYTQRLTDSIIRGLKAGTLIDIDGVVDIENRKIKDFVKEAEEKALAEAKLLAEQEAERLALQEAEKLALEEAERLALEEAEKVALQEAEKTAIEEAEKLAIEEAEKSTAKKKTAAK